MVLPRGRAYAVTALLLVVDTATLLFRGRPRSVFSARLRGIQQLDAPETGGRPARSCGGVACTWSSSSVLTICVCLSLLVVSFAELFSSQGNKEIVRGSRPLMTAVTTRIVFAVASAASAAVVSSCLDGTYRHANPNPHVARMNAVGERGVGYRGPLIASSLTFLGLMLLWRAARLAFTALEGFPNVEELVYLEGFCAIGSIAVVGVLWAQRSSPTPGAIQPHTEDEGGRPCEVEVVTDDVAGWTSAISFSWLNPLFETGASRQLRREDMPKLSDQDRTEAWAERFETVLKSERNRRRQRPSLVRACRIAFGWEFLNLGWLKAANTGMGLSGPLLLKVVVDAVQELSQDEGGTTTLVSRAAIKGYIGAAGLLVVFALSAVLDTQFSLRLGKLQLHVRAAIVSAVYRQVLDVRSVDASKLGLTAGGATNLIAVDAQRLMDTAGSLHELWGLPVQVGVTFYLLHREVSFAFAAGLVVIAAMVPLNAAFAKRIGAASRELMVHKDERVERCSEMLSGIRAVKMLAWEGFMKQRIEASRKDEVSALGALKRVDAWCVFFWATTPTLVCLATFATLVVAYRGDSEATSLKTSSVFAAVSLLQMLIHPMNAFPWVVNGIVEAYVSRGRLEKLLLPSTLQAPPSKSSSAGGEACSSLPPCGRPTVPTVGEGDAALELGRGVGDQGLDDDAIISWKGVTVALSRPLPLPLPQRRLQSEGEQQDQGEEEAGRGSASPPPSFIQGAGLSMSDAEVDILEPLLPSHWFARKGGEEGECGADPPGGKSGENIPGFALRGLDFEIRRGEAVAVVGGVGSGKSTLLSGILGEIPVFDSTPTDTSTAAAKRFESVTTMTLDHCSSTAYCHLDNSWSRSRDAGEGQCPINDSLEASKMRGSGTVRAERVCYSAQTPWVMSGTVRDNVLFGRPMVERRYREVLEACALREDLASIPGGDIAYVGERGATLSGGQRLRVSLARCTYAALAKSESISRSSSRENGGDRGNVLCLLDDPLSSLDARTRRHVNERCVHGLLRKNPAVGLIVVVSGGGGSGDDFDEKFNTTVDDCSERRQALPLLDFDQVFSLGDQTIGVDENNRGRGSPRLPPPETPMDSVEKPVVIPSAAGRGDVIIDADFGYTPEKIHDVHANGRVLLRAEIGNIFCFSEEEEDGQERENEDIEEEKEENGKGNAYKHKKKEKRDEKKTKKEGKEKRGWENVEQIEERRGGWLQQPPPRGKPYQHDASSPRDEANANGGGSFLVGIYEGASDGVERPQEGPVEEEERKDGSVEFHVYLLYVRSAGLKLALVTLVSLGLMQASSAGFRYWLSHWATHQEDVSVREFLVVSLSLALGLAVFTLIRAFGFAWGGISAAVRLHHRLLHSVIAKPTEFFDVTPSGRIVNRFSRDAFSVDDPLPFHLNILLAQASGLLATAVVLSMTSPLLILLFAPLGMFYGRLQRYYRCSSRELRRLDSTSRSPMYALFSETLEGAVTIRAFGQEEYFAERFLKLLAENQRATFAGSMASAWLSLRLQALGVVVVAAVAFLAVGQEHIRRFHPGQDNDEDFPGDSSNPRGSNYEALVGLSLTYALPIVGNLTGLLGALTDTEREMISVERMDEYCRDEDSRGGNDDIASTKRVTEAVRHSPEGYLVGCETCSGSMPTWSDEGRVEMVDVVMRYRADLTPSLTGINLVLSAGEKVGIVGRTGSGKTSLLRVLLRMYPYAGVVKLDGVDTATVPIDILRSRVAVIPQEPLLFRGTVRENLDPSAEYSDAELWQALHRSRLAEPHKTGNDGVTTHRTSLSDSWRAVGGGGVSFRLDRALEGNGGNISAGQRQLLCVARALLRRSKLVCIDEATSRMDAATAELVDTTMAEAFQDATVLTVAHRLPSVVENCNRVVVMSEGRLVEEGHPRKLAKNPRSKFHALLQAQSWEEGVVHSA